jgi:enoyl-[acyl-carrier-protein] reductase (NADH)
VADRIFADARSRIPLRIIGEAKDIAELAVYLVSDEGAAINGQALLVDGGNRL